jgi:hypothetical protein
MFVKHIINPLSPELNPICYFLALLAHDFLHVSRIWVKSLTLRLLMSYIYIYMAHLFFMFLDHTQRSTVGRTPLDEWSARRGDLYLTTHGTYNRQISMSPVGFEPTISAVERPQAAHRQRSWLRISPGAWIFVCCECRVLSGRGLLDELITRPKESYRICCVVVCNLETSRIGAPYIYDIRSLRVVNLILILLTWRKSWANNVSK